MPIKEKGWEMDRESMGKFEIVLIFSSLVFMLTGLIYLGVSFADMYKCDLLGANLSEYL